MDSTNAKDGYEDAADVKGEGDPELKIQELEAGLAKKTKQAEEYMNGIKYLQSDFENYKRRVAREKEETIKQANEPLIKDLLEVYENLERALDTAKKSGDDKMAHGLDMVYSHMASTLEKYGLKPINSVGEKFDPYLHEAVMQESSQDHEDDTILEEYQRGYTLNSKVIRYSKVKVSKR